MKRVVVTGGAGFIGSHLVDRLLEKDVEVKVLDNLSTGRLENLKKAKGYKGFKFLKIDIAQDTLAEELKGFDTVFHLAALADIVPSIQRPTDYFISNVQGTLRILEAARAAKIQRLVYAASSSCYGVPDKYPTPETTPIQCRYPYALTKVLGEEMALHWGQIYKLPVLSLRFFNVYGPRARTSGSYGAVFGVFLAQKIHGKPLTIVGDGKQTRDFTYVSDVVEALIRAAESNLKDEIFNVGSGKTVSVNRIAELLGGDRVALPKRPGEPDCTFADIKKIQSLLGWQPKISIEEGVKNILNEIDAWKDAPVWTQESIKEATKDWFQYLSP